MDAFRHVILTRFNVKIEQAPRPDPHWLEERFSLFERFCLPSVRAQSCRNFVWILFCDPDIPASYRDRIREYSRWSALRPIYFRHMFDSGMARAAVSELARGYTHLITTRLDNDDAICRTFVESVQQRFDGQEFEFLNFTNGYVWHEGRVWSTQHFSNPFVSLVESAAEYTTVYCGNHMEIGRQGPVRQIVSPRGWLQVVHGRNLSNRVWGTPRPDANLSAEFAIQS
jgi:hypothetical protein